MLLDSNLDACFRDPSPVNGVYSTLTNTKDHPPILDVSYTNRKTNHGPTYLTF